MAVAPSSPECDREETSLSDRAMLLEAFTLREQVKSFVARAGERGLGSEVVRLLTVDRPSGVVAAAGAPMTAWRGDLVPDQSMIRIINNVDEFRRLCERPAPGADRFVDWVEDMEDLAGQAFTVEGLDEDDRAYNINAHFRVPFDACILVMV